MSKDKKKPPKQSKTDQGLSFDFSDFKFDFPDIEFEFPETEYTFPDLDPFDEPESSDGPKAAKNNLQDGVEQAEKTRIQSSSKKCKG